MKVCPVFSLRQHPNAKLTLIMTPIRLLERCLPTLLPYLLLPEQAPSTCSRSTSRAPKEPGAGPEVASHVLVGGWCSWKMLTHLVLAKVFMPTKDRPNAGTISASREVGRRSYGRCILCWDLQMLSLATDVVLLDGLRMGRLATAASASVMKLPVHTVSATAVGNWWIA